MLHLERIEIDVGAVVVEYVGIVVIVAPFVHFGEETDAHVLKVHGFQRIDVHLPILGLSAVLLFDDQGIKLRSEALGFARAVLQIVPRIARLNGYLLRGAVRLRFRGIILFAAACARQSQHCGHGRQKCFFHRFSHRVHLIPFSFCSPTPRPQA